MPVRSALASCVAPFAFLLISVTIHARPLAQPPSSSTTADYPDTPGRETVLRVCSGCHTVDSALAQLKSHDDWVKTLDEMGQNGAQATDEEWTQIQAYLDRNFAYVYVNTATAKDLQALLGVTAEVADAIVGQRTTKGAFASIDDLKAVPGVDPAAVDAQKDRFLFSS